MRFLILSIAILFCSFVHAGNVTISVRDDVDAPIVGAVVRVYDDLEPDTVNEGLTNDDGIVILNIKHVPVQVCAWTDNGRAGVTFAGLSDKLTIVIHAPKSAEPKEDYTESSYDKYEDGTPFVPDVVNMKTESFHIGTKRTVKPADVIVDSAVSVPDVSDASAPLDDNLGYKTFSIADTMKVGTVYKVNLRIAKQLSVGLIEGMSSPVERIRVAGTMEAVITPTDPDSAFDIKSISSAVQTVEMDSSFTSWEWTVRPLKSGKHGLNMRIVIKQADITKDVPVFERTIYVIATPMFTVWQFIVAYWQWIIITLIVPPVSWFLKKKFA